MKAGTQVELLPYPQTRPEVLAAHHGTHHDPLLRTSVDHLQSEAALYNPKENTVNKSQFQTLTQ